FKIGMFLLNVAWRRPTLAEAKPQLPSALKSLTTVFEMGTGVTSSLYLPDQKSLVVNRFSCLSYNLLKELHFSFVPHRKIVFSAGTKTIIGILFKKCKHFLNLYLKN